MHYEYSALNEICKDLVGKKFPHSWDEDHLSYCLTEELRDMYSGTTWTSIQAGKFVQMAGAYKLTGKNENKFGDIAIIFIFTFLNGNRFTGVGFLEAKKREKNGHKYPATKKTQLARIQKNAPSAQLLLYDYCLTHYVRPMGPIEALFIPHPYIAQNHSLEYFFHSVPAGLALQLDDFTTNLHPHGVPFPYQFHYRYLMGFDLEYTPAAQKIATGFDPDSGRPSHIVVCKVHSGPLEATDLQQTADFPRIEISPEYVPFEEQ